MKKNGLFKVILSNVVFKGIISISVFLFLIFSSCEKKTADPEDHDTIPLPVTGLFTDANFRVTHNSYSGNLYLIYDNGHRGSIEQQLDLGVRYLELDLLGKSGNDDFEIGHFELLTAIDHSHGNPSSNKLSDWLKVITDWSGENPGHDPILVAIETKNQFTADEWGLMSDFVSEKVPNLVRPAEFDCHEFGFYPCVLQRCII